MTLRTPQHQRQADSFDQAADLYARSRPSYPAESVGFVVPEPARHVLDLGAGTGKLTRLLVDVGHVVTAVEPSVNMSAQLAATVPEATALSGTGECIPVLEASMDALVVAQAWHWMDPARAVPEVARVIRPGGVFSLIWNTWVEDEPWLTELGALIHTNDGAAAARDLARADPRVGPPFGAPERHRQAWEQRLPLDGFVELIASRSYVITLPEAERRDLLARARELAAAHLAEDSLVRVPYLTLSFRYRRPE